jgi:CHAT domain-containing protein
MQEFYTERLGNHKPKAAALAAALRSQIRKDTPAAQWAPFVLIGDWR